MILCTFNQNGWEKWPKFLSMEYVWGTLLQFTITYTCLFFYDCFCMSQDFRNIILIFIYLFIHVILDLYTSVFGRIFFICLVMFFVIHFL